MVLFANYLSIEVPALSEIFSEHLSERSFTDFSQFTLHKLLLKSINELGFKAPTEVQEEVIPLAMDGVDLKVNAETGSGKTVAYLLPTLHQLLSRANPDAGSRALVLLPTRELALQVFNACENLAKHTNLVTELITGGDDIDEQSKALAGNPHIVIATPGRLIKHIEKERTDFFKLDVLIIDEADRMLDMGFSDDVLTIVDSCNVDRQTLLLSATLNGIYGPASEILRDPESISLNKTHDEKSNAQENIEQQIVLADNTFQKQSITYELLEQEEFDKAVVFTNSKTKADRLASFLMHKRLRVGVLHGDLDPERRLRVMELLRSGKVNILIASDLAARGLDVPGVGLVINFEMPRRGDIYVHRIGRTGRAGENGLAISLINSLEWNLMISIERYLKRQFTPREVDGIVTTYKGPSRLKTSGKAAGSSAKKLKMTASERAKKRKRQKKKQDKKLNKRRSEKRADGESPGE